MHRRLTVNSFGFTASSALTKAGGGAAPALGAVAPEAAAARATIRAACAAGHARWCCQQPTLDTPMLCWAAGGGDVRGRLAWQVLVHV
jgi:hypothetical protein